MTSPQGLFFTGRGAMGKGNWQKGPSQTEKALLVRNAELERMVGRLTMENELLKKP